MVMEYMCHGDLLGFLRCSRGHQSMFTISPGIGNHPPCLRLSSRDLINIATKIANGMRYLADRKVSIVCIWTLSPVCQYTSHIASEHQEWYGRAHTKNLLFHLLSLSFPPFSLPLVRLFIAHSALGMCWWGAVWTLRYTMSVHLISPLMRESWQSGWPLRPSLTPPPPRTVTCGHLE